MSSKNCFPHAQKCRYPQEDDNKADENGEGDDNENGASATSPAAGGAGEESSDGGLPVVKGVCVDYIHANRDGASVFGRQKWRESSRYVFVPCTFLLIIVSKVEHSVRMALHYTWYCTLLLDN